MIPRSLINSALRAINAIGATETPTNDMFEDARELLNMMMDSWSAEELLPHDYVQKVFTVAATTPNYTIVDGDAVDADGLSEAASNAGVAMSLTGALCTAGVGTFDVPRHVSITSLGDESTKTFAVVGTNTHGDAITETIGDGTSTGPNVSTVYGVKQFKTVTSITPSTTTAGNVSAGSGTIIDIRRPLKIISAFCRVISTGADTPVLVASRERYNELANKDLAGLPTKLYYDRLYPSGEIYLHPVAATAIYDIHLDLWLPFVNITAAGIDTAINLPSEYLLAFRWNLAAELAPEYGKDVTNFVFQRAEATKDIIRMLNSKPSKPMSMATPVPMVQGQPGFNRN